MNVKLIASGSRPWELWIRHWGVSFLIDDNILFDTFSSYRVLSRKLRNAQTHIDNIQTVVISHNHWDHIGGLWGLLEQRKGIDVYLPAQAKEEVKLRIRAAGSNVIDAAGAKTIRQGIHITDEFVGTHNGNAIPEQAVVLETSKGLVVIFGCAHLGIASIIQKAKQAFHAPVYGALGGFHLRHSPLDDVTKCANKLQEEGVRIVAPTHCTGLRAEKIFKNIFREKFIPLREGENISFI